MIQLRDENHRPLPGVELGITGKKIGDNANDTGYCILKNVRIPREYMLCAHNKVAPDGTFTSDKAAAQFHYSTMMFTRAQFVRTSASWLAKAVTIGIRYSCVREQGFIDTTTKDYKAPENKIIDYKV